MTEPARKTEPSKKAREKDKEKAKGWTGSARKAAERRLPHSLARFSEPRWQRWALVSVTSLVAAFLIAPQSSQHVRLTVGEPAPETIISPITFRVIDEAATSKNHDEVLNSVLPVYDFDDLMYRDIQERIISAFSFMEDYLARAGEDKDRSDTTTPADSPANLEEKRKPLRAMDEDALRQRFENLLGARVSPMTFAVLHDIKFEPRVRRELRSLVQFVMKKGIVSSRELVTRDSRNGILLQYASKDELQKLDDLSEIFDLREAINYINLEDPDAGGNPAVAQVIRRLAMELINVNITYNRKVSEDLKDEAIAGLKPVYFQVSKGEPIVRQGEPVNEGHLRKLSGLRKANPPYSRYMILIGFALTFIIAFRLSLYFSEVHLERPKNTIEDLLLMCLLLLGIIILVRFVASLAPLLAAADSQISPRSVLFAAPVATGAMLLALMVDPRVAFIFAALGALIAAFTVEGDVYLFCFYFVSGIVGLHGMSGIRDRNSVMRAGIVVGLANMFTVVSIKLAMGELTSAPELYEAGLGFLGGVLSGMLVSGLAPLLEPLGYITNIKLLEIANLNHPILKELAIKAPGTHHHSVLVGSLAEAAAEQIGANPLLAKVGAYYHDIGKIGKKTKPEYFIENQRRGGVNPHDKLEPSMSALILVAHVKHGVEKARELKLGKPIVDIIQQHHGSNLIRFFYNKALAKAGKNHQSVSEDKYRYPGPRPQTKEAAVVMLADVVEAASRTLSDPTPARIQKHVQSLVMGLFSEGQLDQSTMTLKDLHAVTKSFVRSLQGSLHGRVDYPEDSRSHPKSEKSEKPNGDPARQSPDKDRNRPGQSEEEGSKIIRRLGL